MSSGPRGAVRACPSTATVRETSPTAAQLLFRVMRVTLSEWLGEAIPIVRNQHVSSLVCIALAIVVVLTGTWIYLWQLLGGANQLMAALALLLVTVWLASVGKNWLYAGLPAAFMYVTTIASLLVSAYNIYANVYKVNAVGADSAHRRLGDPDLPGPLAGRGRHRHRDRWCPGVPAVPPATDRRVQAGRGTSLAGAGITHDRRGNCVAPGELRAPAASGLCWSPA